MQINNFFQSKIFKIIIISISCVVVFSFVFSLGIIIGYKKATFTYQWSENYHQNFAGPEKGFMHDFRQEMRGGDFTESHGVAGQIIKIDGSTLVIKGRNGMEKIVLVPDDASIMRFRQAIKVSDLKNDDDIIIIGEPDDRGELNAKFIRLIPPPPQMIIR